MGRRRPGFTQFDDSSCSYQARNMNSVDADLTKGIDGAVSQVQQTAQQFLTAFDTKQSLESKTDLHRGTAGSKQELATASRIEPYSGDPYQVYEYMKKLEKKITELLSPKKWRNLERLGQVARPSPQYHRRPTSNRRCISTIPWKALQTLISKMESYKRC